MARAGLPAEVIVAKCLGLLAILVLVSPMDAWSGERAPTGIPGLLEKMIVEDWVGAAIATGIIFAILGKKLGKDIRGWLA